MLLPPRLSFSIYWSASVANDNTLHSYHISNSYIQYSGIQVPKYPSEVKKMGRQKVCPDLSKNLILKIAGSLLCNKIGGIISIEIQRKKILTKNKGE